MPEKHAVTVVERKSQDGGSYATVILVAVGLVMFVWLLTNHMAPQWDMFYYLDMAANGLRGNTNLAAPFAYRPGAPLLVHALAQLTGLNVETVFRVCDAAMCVAFIAACFWFARRFGAHRRTALTGSVCLALNFFVVKWTLFSGTMVDIYAYPFLLLAFAAILESRFYVCLLVSAAGLFFKEFLLIPLAIAGVLEARRLLRRNWDAAAKLSLLLATVILCFVLPRLLIPVARTFQDVDPLNDGSTLRRLLTYPLSKRHDFNILYAYLAGWLPILMLLTPSRWNIVWSRVRPHALVFGLFLLFHFVLVMYGGTNIDIYITYCAPLQLIVFAALVDAGSVKSWEIVLVLIATIAFNRILERIPFPGDGMDAYLDFYGGYYMRVTQSSFVRMGEVVGCIAIAGLLRQFVGSVRNRNGQMENMVSETSGGVA